MARIDLELVNRNFCKTRSQASKLISANCVFVNDKLITKNSFSIDENDKIIVKDNDALEFVSRGGKKLLKAINTFNIDFKDKVICDIGSSTGGFTDCSLKHGALKVYAIDVGSSQLDESLINDTRVVCMENTNFKDVSLASFNENIDYYVCDVSFISLKQIIYHLSIIDPNFQGIFLYKPQFEVGPKYLNKQGKVKDDNAIINSLNEFNLYLNSLHKNLEQFTFSPLLGNKSGNIEFLLYINNRDSFKTYDFKTLVLEFKKELKND